MAERLREEKIDINNAPLEVLDRIEGLSRGGAEAIVDFRERHGGISSMEELLRLPQLSVDEVLVLQDAIQITVSDRQEAGRLEKKRWKSGYRKSGGKGI